jgi:hypothetical protein
VLQGVHPSEEDIAAAQIGKAATPIGKPIPIGQMSWPPKP